MQRISDKINDKQKQQLSDKIDDAWDRHYKLDVRDIVDILSVPITEGLLCGLHAGRGLCDKAMCQQWDKEHNRCAILSIAINTGRL